MREGIGWGVSLRWNRIRRILGFVNNRGFEGKVGNEFERENGI